MKILVLSPYDAMSHRLWRNSLPAMLPDAQWTTLTLPPRHFTWRIRGNGLTWAMGERRIIDGGYDLVIATSMTDLSTLRGLAPSIARIPTILYFHENQFAYPRTKRAHPSIDPLVVQLYAAIAADAVAFNSEHNRTTFMDGVRYLLKRLPDGVPGGIAESLEKKLWTVPVPVDGSWFDQTTPRDTGGPLHIVWNHRWEYDKGPDRMLDGLTLLDDSGVDFRVHVLGQRFRTAPPALTRMQERLSHRIDTFGFVDDAEAYRRIITGSDVVLSTALHDFQGLSVLEATAAGCVPVVPDRLAYPDFIPEGFRYPSHPDDAVAEAEALSAHLAKLATDKMQGAFTPAPDVSRLSSECLAPEYRKLVDAVVRS